MVSTWNGSLIEILLRTGLMVLYERRTSQCIQCVISSNDIPAFRSDIRRYDLCTSEGGGYMLVPVGKATTLMASEREGIANAEGKC